MQSAEAYDTQVRDKIFLIGQNDMQGASATVPNATMGDSVFGAASISQQASHAQAKARSQKTKRLSKNTLKQLKRLQEAQAPALKYATFAQMNALWLQYITALLQLRKEDKEKGVDLTEGAIQTGLCSKLVKADFSGARLKIVKSKNSLLVGTEGLIVRETARTFVLISPDDVVKTIPKEATVF